MRVLSEELLKEYEAYLWEEEKSGATVRKYLCDLRKLMAFAGGREIDKRLMIAFKEHLQEQVGYRVSSVNSFLVAANGFLVFMGWHDARVKTCRIQREAFCPEEKCLTKAEYKRLVREAQRENNPGLALILQTICATGIRVSELSYITREQVAGGCVTIRCKGKTRTILIPSRLQKELLAYAVSRKIRSGVLFRTRDGKPIHRSCVWRAMKALCHAAGVEEKKVFPHNLRHLFAQCFYALQKDIAKLADVLGHSSIETTRIYIRTTGEEHRKQLELLGLVC